MFKSEIFFAYLLTNQNSMGYNGRECILRALCETSQFFGKKGTTMVKELLRTAFRYVKQEK